MLKGNEKSNPSVQNQTNKEGKEEFVVRRCYRNIKNSYWHTEHETVLGGKWDQWSPMGTEGCIVVSRLVGTRN